MYVEKKKITTRKEERLYDRVYDILRTIHRINRLHYRSLLGCF